MRRKTLICVTIASCLTATSSCSRPETDAWNRGCEALKQMMPAVVQGDIARASDYLREAASEAETGAAANGDIFYQKFRNDTAIATQQADASNSIDLTAIRMILKDDCLHGND